MNTETDRLADEPESCVCLLWMPQQTELLLHTEAVRILCFCLLWMPQQMDLLLLHTYMVRILCFTHHGHLNRGTCCCTWTLLGFYVYFSVDDSTDRHVVVHGHCYYVYVPDLLYVLDFLWRQQSKPWMNCIIYV